MVSINISIKDEAYQFLRTLKTKDKSFSDVILKFKEKEENKNGKSLLRFAGVLKNTDWGERMKGIKRFREAFNKSLGGKINDRT